jgi:hypothetical protein
MVISVVGIRKEICSIKFSCRRVFTQPRPIVFREATSLDLLVGANEHQWQKILNGHRWGLQDTGGTANPKIGGEQARDAARATGARGDTATAAATAAADKRRNRRARFGNRQ